VGPDPCPWHARLRIVRIDQVNADPIRNKEVRLGSSRAGFDENECIAGHPRPRCVIFALQKRRIVGLVDSGRP